MDEGHEWDTYTLSSKLRAFVDANYGNFVNNVYITLMNNPSGPHNFWVLYYYEEMGVACEQIQTMFQNFLEYWGFKIALQDWRVPDAYHA